MWRCLKDLFGYCEGKPKFSVKPTTAYLNTKEGIIDIDTHYGSVCKGHPSTCGKYLTQSQKQARREAQQA